MYAISPGVLDYVLLISLLLGTWKGWRRGAEKELQASIATLLLLGFLGGLWSSARVRGGIYELISQEPLLSGVMGTLLAFISTWWLLRGLRYKLPAWLAGQLQAGRSARWGAILGTLRRGVILVFLILVAVAVLPSLLNQWLLTHSALARWCVELVPGV